MKVLSMLLLMLLTASCSNVRQLEPLSSCKQWYVLSELSPLEWTAFQQTHKLEYEKCTKSKLGCSMVIGKHPLPGVAVSVVVTPVAKVKKDGCVYASDTQRYYSFDSNGVLINSPPDL